MRSKNACKTCALGMGGQKGGMRNEQGHWPEVCKKSFQAMAADMQGAISPDFFRRYSIEQLKTLSSRELEMAGRIVEPMFLAAGDTHYRPLSWEAAIDKVVTDLKATEAKRSFFYFSGRSSNEAGFLTQLFARLYGTNNVNNCSYYCHQASGVGLGSTIGTGTATIEFADLEKCDLFFLIGANPSSNHPRLMSCLKNIRKRGGRVVVVNPVKETGLMNFKVPSDPISLIFGSEIASDFIQLKVGGDIAFMHGIAKVIVGRKAQNRNFIRDSTVGFEAYELFLRNLSWHEIERGSGILKGQIEEIAKLYINSENTVFSWCMGITHHEHGVGNVQTIANLSLLRGMIGRPGAGLLPIRGHSNVQGMGTMGVTPKLKAEIFSKLTAMGMKLPEDEGMDTMACMERSHASGVDFAWCLGGNLYGSNPDLSYAREAMSKIKMVVNLNTTLNTGHAWGLGKETLLLPVLARDEEKQKTTQESMFSFVRLSDGGQSNVSGPRSEVEIICEIAAKLFGNDGPIDWEGMKAHRNIRQLISKSVPGFGSFDQIDNNQKEFHIPGRLLHQPRFKMPNGRAEFKVSAIPEPGEVSKDKLVLMSIRSEGQFNTVVYEEADLYRGQERRDVILMNVDDMRRLKLAKDDRVCVRSDTGAMKNILVRPFDVRAGAALMYFPEVNEIISRKVDPSSRTPAYKNTLISIEKYKLAH